MVLTGEEVTRITNYLDVTTPLPDKADLIFVFGTRFPEPAYRAVELFKSGISDLIVLTGGINRINGVNEAQAHQTILREGGVPKNCMICETESTNTLENVTFALPRINQRLNITKFTHILIVAKWMNSRRALMTLKRHLPAGIQYSVTTYEVEEVGRSNWHLLDEKRVHSVLKNWERIPVYLEWGHLAEVERKGDVYV
jgi:uncharacterized SAM-binding protein YcdF (DUF218 family)